MRKCSRSKLLFLFPFVGLASFYIWNLGGSERDAKFRRPNASSINRSATDARVTMTTGGLHTVIESPAKDVQSLWRLVDEYIGTSDVLYPATFDVDPVLGALRTARVTFADFFEDSETFKLILHLEGDQKANFKLWLTPAYGRGEQICDGGCEHPEYEVANFAFSRMLNLRIMPFTVGRQFDWFKDIKPFATEKLQEMVNETANGDVTVAWACSSRKEETFRFAGGIINGSLIYWVNRQVKERRLHLSTSGSETVWERFHAYHRMNDFLFKKYKPGDDTYCRHFRSHGLYASDYHFLYVLDTAVFDFLVLTSSNKHTYFAGEYSDKINVLIDRGKGFRDCECDDRQVRKDTLLLAPVFQCCRVRLALFKELVRLNTSYSILEEEFNRLTRADFYYPVTPHSVLRRVYARLVETLDYVKFCINKAGNDTFM